jgi:hypothetical protein
VPLSLDEALQNVICRHGFWDYKRGVDDALYRVGILEQVFGVDISYGLIDVISVDDNLG